LAPYLISVALAFERATPSYRGCHRFQWITSMNWPERKIGNTHVPLVLRGKSRRVNGPRQVGFICDPRGPTGWPLRVIQHASEVHKALSKASSCGQQREFRVIVKDRRAVAGGAVIASQAPARALVDARNSRNKDGFFSARITPRKQYRCWGSATHGIGSNERNRLSGAIAERRQGFRAVDTGDAPWLRGPEHRTRSSSPATITDKVRVSPD